MKYNIGDIIKVNIKNKVYNAIITDIRTLFDQQLYSYVVQTIEGKVFYDYHKDLEIRELEAINMILETALKDYEIPDR
jgi:hypothetical protein